MNSLYMVDSCNYAFNVDIIFKELPNNIVTSYYDSNEPNSLLHVGVYRQTLIDFAAFIKLSSVFSIDSAIDAFAVDSIENYMRFTIIYSLQSSTFNVGLRLVTKATDGLSVISLQNLYPAFNGAEREMGDLSGIFFSKHPDLRRILTDYGFSGHPLRKDFPVSGFKEAHYGDDIKQVTYSDVELAQSFRLPAISSTGI